MTSKSIPKLTKVSSDFATVIAYLRQILTSLNLKCAFINFGYLPLEIAAIPVLAISFKPRGSINSAKASIFSGVPVI